MSDDSLDSPLPKLKKKNRNTIITSSDSDTDSDSEVVRIRKRLRVNESDCDSSGSSIQISSRQKKTLPKVIDSDGSCSSGWSTEEEEENEPKPSTSAGCHSDSSDGTSEKCPICLLRINDQEIGIPETCEHMFCFDCITEWSKNVNTCPVDRLTFNKIVVRRCAGGRVTRKVEVQAPVQQQIDEIIIQEDPTFCEVCHSSADESHMLLCDGCDLGYHMQCLSPPLEEVPLEHWFCPSCEPDAGDIEDYIFISELDDLLMDNEDITMPMGPRPSVLRNPPQNRRTSRNTSNAGEGSSVNTRNASSGGTSRSAGTTRRRTAPTRRRRRRQTTRRRRTGAAVEYEVSSTGKFPITKKTAKKRKKRKSTRKPRTAARRKQVKAGVRATLQKVLADTNGVNAPVQSIGLSRYRAGITNVSLFGNPNELDYFSDEEVPTGGGGDVATSVRAAARPTSEVLAAMRQVRRKVISIPSPQHASQAPDVLSSILEQQTALHSKNTVISLTNEGQINYKVLEPYPKKGIKDKSEDSKNLGDVSPIVKTTPMYSGGGRGTGNWSNRGGFRNDGSNPNYHVSGNYSNYNNHDTHNGNYQGGSFNGDSGRNRDDGWNHADHSIPRLDLVSPFVPVDRRLMNNRQMRGRGMMNRNQNRYSMDTPWYPNESRNLERHSFGEFDNAIDMSLRQNDVRSDVTQPDCNQEEYPEPSSLIPPPSFEQFDLPKPASPPSNEPVDEEFISNAGMDARTDQPESCVNEYDPTEPTNDDSDSEKDEKSDSGPLERSINSDFGPPTYGPSSSIGPVSSGNHSDDDDNGECPNFSIYSATSVHIAKTVGSAEPSTIPFQQDLYDPEVDLVQEDDEDEEPQKTEEDLKIEDAYKEKLSKKCPITPNKREPIKIKLNTPSVLVRMPSSTIYEEEEMTPEETMNTATVVQDEKVEKDIFTDIENLEVTEKKSSAKSSELSCLDKKNEEQLSEPIRDNFIEKELTPDITEEKVAVNEDSPSKDNTIENPEQKITEAVSESEDERSFTPCLDENRSKDNSIEVDKEIRGLEGLETEMISEEESNEMFNEQNKEGSDKSSTNTPRPQSGVTPELSPPVSPAVNEISVEKNDKTSKKQNKAVDINFKKLSRSGKGRNYRDKDEGGRRSRERRSYDRDARNKSKSRREKRKDLERYDVRFLVTERKRRVKDAFGRDASRSPSRTRSLSKSKRSLSRGEKSPSRGRRSLSKGRRSPSKMKRSLSRLRKSPARIRRSISRRRSLSRRKRSPSVSRARPRALSPRARRSLSRGRYTPTFGRNTSPIRGKRSRSRSRRKSRSPLRLRRTPSPKLRRKRSISPKIRNRSPSLKFRKKKRSKLSPLRSPAKEITKKKKKELKGDELRNRSRSPKKKSRKTKRGKSGSPKRKAIKSKKKSRKSKTPSPELLLSPDPNLADWREKSPAYQEWSSDHSYFSKLLSPGCTPPRPPNDSENIRVIFNTENRERNREKRRGANRIGKHSRHSRDGGPSKEVFTSGDNILVSLSFNNKDNNLEPSQKRRRKESKRDRRKLASRMNDDNAKPVAIIDLDKSPFLEIQSSPKNVIVLSDSDSGEKDTEKKKNDNRTVEPAVPLQDNTTAARESHFNGPKTPPEPTVKFTLASKAQQPLRAVNPLQEEDAGIDDEIEQGEIRESAPKGPNTPPEPPNSPPSSHDAYDPFEPTKSRSQTPDGGSKTDQKDAQSDFTEKTAITLETAQKTNLSADDVVNQRPISPMEKVLALLQSTKNVSPTRLDEQLTQEDKTIDNEGNILSQGSDSVNIMQSPDKTKTVQPYNISNDSPKPVYSSVVPTVVTTGPVYGVPRIGAFTSTNSPNAVNPVQPQRILLPSPKGSPLKTQAPKLFLAKPSPIKSNPIKPLQSKSLIANLPLPTIKPIPGLRKKKKPELVDITEQDSPYSPGSSDFGDLFEPPNSSDPIQKNKKQDGNIFETLFGGNKTKRRGLGRRKKGKTKDDSSKPGEEIPGSAVEMQVKNKYIKKLNRQERVVEEVKFVLKPHYNKKHVTKEEYKDILRKAVPKICHSKSGEINPAKIHALIEAYVKKYRKRRKLAAVT